MFFQSQQKEHRIFSLKNEESLKERNFDSLKDLEAKEPPADSIILNNITLVTHEKVKGCKFNDSIRRNSIRRNLQMLDTEFLMTVWPFLKKKKLKKKKFLTTKAYKLGNLEKIKIIYNVCPKMIKEKINLEGDEKPEEFLEYIRRKISESSNGKYITTSIMYLLFQLYKQLARSGYVAEFYLINMVQPYYFLRYEAVIDEHQPVKHHHTNLSYDLQDNMEDIIFITIIHSILTKTTLIEDIEWTHTNYIITIPSCEETKNLHLSTKNLRKISNYILNLTTPLTFNDAITMAWLREVINKVFSQVRGIDDELAFSPTLNIDSHWPARINEISINLDVKSPYRKFKIKFISPSEWVKKTLKYIETQYMLADALTKKY
ncbi:hypothetical protein H8356DRAFT_1431811 [Neocallimastix lanati (nom. inval.)]|nr:hypothetical protein H8356DRAFT_1431811 [Neocallimastix sp. JGI-2020a]